jgi:acyl dehydratase
MPFVFEKEGFRFAFYSNDHRPIHVHVRKAGAEAIFDVEDEVELANPKGSK